MGPDLKLNIPVHEYGYVSLIDKMGDDEAVVQAARISYDSKGKSADRQLIRYLLRHQHTSPFEMAVLKFEVKMPIFVARQWVRHRTASMNEVSARYTQLPEEMFVPTEFMAQSTANKQGRQAESSLSDPAMQKALRNYMEVANARSYGAYDYLLDCGVARETAREVLNLNIYTKFVWKMDLHNLMHFMKLRLHPHAQKEIRDYAEAVEAIVGLHFPICHEAFVDYMKESYTCSRMEVELLQVLLWHEHPDYSHGEVLKKIKAIRATMSQRENDEFDKRFFP